MKYNYNVEYPENYIDKLKKVDIILSFEVAEHYERPEEYLNEIINRLNPNGYLIKIGNK